MLSSTISFGATFCVSNEAELQAALTAAASNGEDDTIQIVQGTYNGNFVYASTEANNLTVEGGYTEGCASREIDPANTVLDGGGTDMVLALVSQGAANFTLEGLTLQNGASSTNFNGGGNLTSSATTGITIGSAGAHTHSVSCTAASTGSSGTNANLPPYIVVKMWQRTA